jgi:hypothetical protein
VCQAQRPGQIDLVVNSRYAEQDKKISAFSDA